MLMSGNYIGVIGIIVILGIAVAFSSNRKAINFRVVGAALALQVAVATFVLYFDAGRVVYRYAQYGRTCCHWLLRGRYKHGFRPIGGHQHHWF